MGQYVGIEPAPTQHDHRSVGRRRRGARHRTLRQPALRAGPGHGRRRLEPEVVVSNPPVAGIGRPILLQELGAHVHLAHTLGNNWVQPTCQERRARRRGPGRHVGPRAPRGGLDRAARGPRAARAGALSLFAHPAPDQCQGPDPWGHGQERNPARRRRAVGTDRSGPTRRSRTPRGLCPAPRLVAQPPRRLRAFDRRARRAHPRPAQGRPRLSGRHDAARGGQGHRRHLRGRDR